MVVCWVPSSSFSSKETTCFVCFRLFCVLLWKFVHKQPGSAFFTNKNVSRSFYKTIKRFASLFVETLLARTKHISNGFFELILDSLQKCKHFGQTTWKKTLFDLQKEYYAPGTQTRSADIDNLLPRDWRVCLCRQSLPEYFIFGHYPSPMRLTVPLLYPQPGVNA